MSFGKRGGLPSSRPGRQPASAGTPSPLWGQLGRLAFGVGVGLTIIWGANALLMPRVGKALTQRFEQHPAEAALANVYPSTSAELIAACPAPAFGIELPSRGRDPMTAIERDLVAEGRKVKRLARHVSCLMEHRRERFCAAQARYDLALLVRTYLAMRQDAFKYAERVLRLAEAEPAMPRAAQIESGLISRPRSDGQPGSAPRDPSIAEAVRSLTEMDRDLFALLAGLVRDGYVTGSDFSGFLGFFMPSELAPLFASTQPERKSCR